MEKTFPALARRPKKPRRLGDAAFTIAEVVMSTFVLSLGIATSIIALQSGFKQIDVARGTTLASQIIQSEMERLRMMPWSKTTPASVVDSISELPASETFDGATYFSNNPELTGKYSITRTVTADATRPTEVVNIVVSVRWRSYDLRWHQRSFSSIYAKNGLYDYYYTIAHP
jgi:Tfp pilus assembly protein PilV